MGELRMNRFNAALAIAVLSLSTLTACGEETKTVTEGAKVATSGKDTMTGTMDKAKNMAGNVMAMKDGAPAMIAGVTATTAAVKAGDFAKAKDEVVKLQGTWGKMREATEKKSPESYKAINEGLDKAQTELSEPKPETAKVLASLEAISGPLKTLVGMK